MPRNVLYIDDDEGLCRLVTRTLDREGIRVVTAVDGESGLKALAAEEFDVIALDQNMPGLDGLATLERIHEIPSHPPVIFVTAEQNSRLVVTALKAGAFDYVIKDSSGEFIPLLKVAFQTAVESMRLRRAKIQSDAEVREARDRFEALAAERAVLLREVSHRVGNSLQLIASMLSMQGNASAQPEVKHALGAATSRVMAVAQVHRSLYTSDDVQSVAVDQYLKGLVSDLRRSAESDELAQIAITAEPVEIDPDRVVAIGVIVSELVINARKYAYPGKSGPIRVTLTRRNQNLAMISVEDDGVGFDGSGPPRANGLGRRIVSAMADKLNATIEHDTTHPGTKLNITFPIAREKPPVRES
jgi:two-component sensor histidine kinase